MSLEFPGYPPLYLKVYVLGPDAPEHISGMAMDGNAIWVSSGIYSIKYIRGKEVSIHMFNVGIGSHILSGSTSNEPPRIESRLHHDIWLPVACAK